MPEPAENTDKPKKTPKPRAKKGTARLEALKKKYRLDDEVNINDRGVNGEPLGRGPVLDPKVFNTFAALDESPDKRYLDWMLFQAGGGQAAFNKARELWGDNKEPKTPEIFYSEFLEQRDPVVLPDELREISRRLKGSSNFPGFKESELVRLSNEIAAATRSPNLHTRFLNVQEILTNHQIAPGKERSAAVEIVTSKLKAWMRKQLSTPARDRVHATSIFTRMAQGMTREKAEEAWNQVEERRRREYLFGDQDSVKWDAFGFYRFWPGRNNIYQKILDEMKKYLENSEKVVAYNTRFEEYNKRLREKNASLPPEQQVPESEMPLRKPITFFDLKIGKVTNGKEGNLEYSGTFQTLQSMVQANKQMLDLPLKDKISQDIRYAGPPGPSYAGPAGAHSRTAKVYSDQNVDVRVPLTVAAAIEAGRADWPISDPNQIGNINSDSHSSSSAWGRYTTGNHNHPEWSGSPAIHFFFELKDPGMPPDMKKIMMLAFLDDLVDLHYPFLGTVWQADSGKLKFKQILQQLRALPDQKIAMATGQSLVKAMKAIKHWGQEFNPKDMVSDYVQHYKDSSTRRRRIGESLKILAAQAVDALIS